MKWENDINTENMAGRDAKKETEGIKIDAERNDDRVCPFGPANEEFSFLVLAFSFFLIAQILPSAV